VCCAIFRGRVILRACPGGVGRMGDDSSKSPLTRRVPGATRAGPASSSRADLPTELLQRMQAVVNAAHAQAKQEEEAPGKQAASEHSAATQKRTFTMGASKSSNGVRPKLTGPLRERLSDEDAEFATDELPRLTASGSIASSTAAGAATAPPYRAPKPGRGDHAAKRDRRAERRERAAQAERERAEQAARERTERDGAERERAREAELAARAAKVLQERERAAREQADQEAATRAEHERTEREQAEREHVERVQAERSARERAEREQAEKAEREKAERERAERDRAARERERAAHERAAGLERERAAYEAERERERAAQAERERAEQELEQARRERAERESVAPGKRATPADANSDNTTQLIAASTNSAATTNGAAKPDSADDLDWAFGPDETAKPNGTAKPVERRPTAARADVLEHPRRTAHQKPVRRRGRTIALVAAAAVIVAAGPVAIVLSRHTAAPPDGSGSTLRNKAAAWIAQQVSPNDVVSCDLAMCQTLEAYGVSTGNLLVMNSADDHLQNSKVVVSTSAIRHIFGRRLDSDYAPTVIASFGSGKAKIEVRVVASQGAKIYLSQFGTDLLQRKTFGTTLAGSSRILATAAAKRQMDAGQVDARILIMFLPLLHQEPSINVLGFGDSGPGASPDVPLRSVYLAETGAMANVREVLALLHAQKSPYRPARAETVRFDGKRALYVEFAAPPPLGLITQ
jgi:hypothetical protein